ncbi:YybH family protein [Alkalihalobacillus pseudalcaliphilus]|uniref:YybH family protein n=1 Tax=Alkalihalobacillus pseudalcaliphilus TaxID=79884 RepID=UPI00064D9F4E|nr:nuclear transport factor 2 family protein [Alkalihalobacillus pseudalcaliphilus]KMK75557.1 cag pathogenicity island protein Cag4 [Alkalihalobacillus pseudalcaliphilus]
MKPEEILEAYINATNTHDFGNVKKLLHPDAVYWFTDRVCTSHYEIGQYFEKAWCLIKEEKYSAENIQWLVKAQEHATCIYEYRYEGYRDGKFVKGNGRATNVFVKDKDNDWKLVHEHLSSLPT